MNRLMMKVRANLIAIIYSATLHDAPPLSRDTASLSLMTVDVEKAMVGFEDIHELWVSLVHIALAVYILAIQMSWACVAPIVVCLGK